MPSSIVRRPAPRSEAATVSVVLLLGAGPLFGGCEHGQHTKAPLTPAAGSSVPMARGDKEEAVAEALIRNRMDDWAKALCAKDIEGVMSLYASSIVSFDIDPPLRYAGADNKRRAWKQMFAAYAGPIAYELRELNVTTEWWWCTTTFQSRQTSSTAGRF